RAGQVGIRSVLERRPRLLLRRARCSGRARRRAQAKPDLRRLALREPAGSGTPEERRRHLRAPPPDVVWAAESRSRRSRLSGPLWRDRRARDGAYHQGTAWAWLLGPFALAHFKAYGDATAALSFLAPLADHLGDFGIGSIAEIFDGDPPFTPGGCIAQAWSVAETLRVWHELHGK